MSHCLCFSVYPSMSVPLCLCLCLPRSHLAHPSLSSTLHTRFLSSCPHSPSSPLPAVTNHTIIFLKASCFVPPCSPTERYISWSSLSMAEFLFVYLYLYWVWLDSPGSPQTRGAPASVSQVLRLQVCSPAPDFNQGNVS